MILCIESLAGSFENCKKLGVENKIVKELQFFQKKEKSISYLSKDDKSFFIGKNIKHIILPKKTPNALKNLTYLFYPLVNLKEFRNSDEYYIHNISGTFPAVLAKLLLKNKRIISRYDWNWAYTFKHKYPYPVYLATKFLEYLSLKHSDLVIATTKRLKKDIKKITDKNKNVAILPNWADNSIFYPKKTINHKSSPLIISVGRLDDGKNHILLLKAVKLLEKIKPKVLIIGQGETKKKLLTYAKENNIKLTIIDKVPNKKIGNLYRRADIFVMTSKYEGLPHVLVEALSCGLPVIGTDVRGINDIIKKDYNGILCPEDEKIIADQIRKVAKHKNLKQKLRKNALKSVKGFAFDVIMNKTYKLIKNGS